MKASPFIHNSFSWPLPNCTVLTVRRFLLLYTLKIDGFLHLEPPTHSKPLGLLVH